MCSASFSVFVGQKRRVCVALLTLSLTNAALLVRGFFPNWDFREFSLFVINLAGGQLLYIKTEYVELYKAAMGGSAGSATFCV